MMSLKRDTTMPIRIPVGVEAAGVYARALDRRSG